MSAKTGRVLHNLPYTGENSSVKSLYQHFSFHERERSRKNKERVNNSRFNYMSVRSYSRPSVRASAGTLTQDIEFLDTEIFNSGDIVVYGQAVGAIHSGWLKY
eukprot:gb/GECG01011554.1/.p1 GENE.gb/GECG01011554.1/~~gb/GECG01011554.1/.p1  ORF type:complete len:103 (+),score=6.24 gb/GECG01011554.1/:1-309(+)